MVAPQYPPAVGGVATHVGELARGLVERGVDVEVATCDPTGRLPRTSLDDGVRVHRFPTLANDDVFYVSPALGQWIVRNARRFELLHGHSYHTPVALTAFVAARLAGCPFVLAPYYHGTGHSALKRLLHVPYRPLGMLIVRHAQVIVCVSKAEQTQLRRDFGAKLPTIVVPSGVDIDAILAATPLEEDAGAGAGRIVLAAGRLETYKRVDRVIDAMIELPDHRLVVIGSGPARSELEGQVTRSGLQERVTFLGAVPREELLRWFRTAAVFVTLSEHESFGITLLEAAVAGAGLVASDIPAHREVSGYVPDAPIGWIAAASPPRSIAAAITATRRSPTGAPGSLGVPVWSQTVDRTIEAYERALVPAPTRIRGR